MYADKVKGMIIGAALGDSYGLPYEHTLDTFTGRLVDYISVTKYGSVTKRYAGSVTDDTEMIMINMLNIILNEGTWSRDTAITEYMRWAKKSYCIGKNTRELFKESRTKEEYEKKISSPSKLNMESNGALMRCAPLALLPISLALDDCKLTNPGNVSIAVNVIYLTLLKCILYGDDYNACIHTLRHKCSMNLIDEIQGCLSSEQIDTITLAIDQAINKVDRDITGSTKGWCVHGLYCAIYSLLHFNDFISAMQWIIRPDSDTDTNACISGAALGAVIGFEKLSVLPDVDTLIHFNNKVNSGVQLAYLSPHRLLDYCDDLLHVAN